MSIVAPASAVSLLGQVDRLRQEASGRLDPHRRSDLGQYFTPAATARLMASMALGDSSELRVLDPGAGVGVLTAAWVAEMCSRARRPSSVVLIAYELDESLIEPLGETLAACQRECARAGVASQVEIYNRDFIEDAVETLDSGLWGSERPAYDLAILNPPYKKFRADSKPRQLLRRLGMETSNLYTAFVALVVRLLRDGGEMVAITPRSFCNGPYFRPFRHDLLRSMSLMRLHMFESRSHAFRDDDVLQENVILHARKSMVQQRHVMISHTQSPDDTIMASRLVEFDRVVHPREADSFIHLVPDEPGHALAARMRSLPHTIDQIGLSVSTGRVVDFRARMWLRREPGPDTVPLIYPAHFSKGTVAWPKLEAKKPNAIVLEAGSRSLMVPSGIYVLVKRFSSKEERRRVVAAVFDPTQVPGAVVGFENHLNYFHAEGAPLARAVAVGLAAFLNSSQVDQYFRQFNGHTQVNATDLRTLRYPAVAQLEALGRQVGARLANQVVVDSLVDGILSGEQA